MKRVTVSILALGLLLGLGLGSLAAAQPPDQLPLQLYMIGVDPSRANIPLDEILSGGPPPNGIPALNFRGDWRGAARATPIPRYVDVDDAGEWLSEREPVIALELGGQAKAYPLRILTRHEIVNDDVGGVPVAVTFCPLCNSALAFDRRIPLTRDGERALKALHPGISTRSLSRSFLDAYRFQQGDFQENDDLEVIAGLEVTFGVSGMLYNSNLIMFDTHTSTLWSQILGEGNVGTLTGTRLLRYPAQIVSFAEFREAFPRGRVLSQQTGFLGNYGRNPYPGYDSADEPPFLFVNRDGTPRESDGRLLAQSRVVSLELRGEAVAYPFDLLRELRVIQDEAGGVPLAVFWTPGAASAIDATEVAEGRDVGAVGVFRRELDGRLLTFRWDGNAFVDDQTGSSWNLLGQATRGELAGRKLEPIVHDNTLWFAWAAFRPDTRVYGQEGSIRLPTVPQLISTRSNRVRTGALRATDGSFSR